MADQFIAPIWRRIARASRAHDWPRAVRLYRKALARVPDAPEIWAQYGHALHETGDIAGAAAAYRRAADLASRQGVVLLLENLNPEPDDAEVQYLAHDLEECQFFFSQLDSPALRWSFTVNHAHLTPDGIDGFLDALDLGRCGEVRLADCRGTIEEHLYPGQGSIDFAAMFARIESEGYRGHYMQAFGSLDDMLSGRETLAAMARKPGA